MGYGGSGDEGDNDVRYLTRWAKGPANYVSAVVMVVVVQWWWWYLWSWG